MGGTEWADAGVVSPPLGTPRKVLGNGIESLVKGMEEVGFGSSSIGKREIGSLIPREEVVGKGKGRDNVLVCVRYV